MIKRRPTAWRGTTALLALVVVPVIAVRATAGPVIEPGDMALRHDIQRLADYGIIKGPTSTWPLGVGANTGGSARGSTSASLPPAIADSVSRVRLRGRSRTQTHMIGIQGWDRSREKPHAIRSFQIRRGVRRRSPWVPNGSASGSARTEYFRALIPIRTAKSLVSTIP